MRRAEIRRAYFLAYLRRLNPKVMVISERAKQKEKLYPIGSQLLYGTNLI